METTEMHTSAGTGEGNGAEMESVQGADAVPQPGREGWDNPSGAEEPEEMEGTPPESGGREQEADTALIMQSLGRKYGVNSQDVHWIAQRLAAEEEAAKRSAENVALTRRQRTENTRENAMRQHFMQLTRQSEQLRRDFPAFDLMREIRNPQFLRLTAPGSGISVKDAFYALHGEEIQRRSMEYAARQAGRSIAASVQAGASRPTENGLGHPGAVTMRTRVENLDKEAREAIRRRVRNGEMVSF